MKLIKTTWTDSIDIHTSLFVVGLIFLLLVIIWPIPDWTQISVTLTLLKWLRGLKCGRLGLYSVQNPWNLDHEIACSNLSRLEISGITRIHITYCDIWIWKDCWSTKIQNSIKLFLVYLIFLNIFYFFTKVYYVILVFNFLC